MSATIHQLFSDHSYGPEAVKAMGAAYDLACKQLPSDIDHEAIARSILLAADSGDRSIDALCAAAVEANERRRKRV